MAGGPPQLASSGWPTWAIRPGNARGINGLPGTAIRGIRATICATVGRAAHTRSHALRDACGIRTGSHACYASTDFAAPVIITTALVMRSVSPQVTFQEETA